ncbi:MAG: 1-hydroxycarotenoid 3,4-desaturase CrtD [Pseudomonadota bacterium]
MVRTSTGSSRVVVVGSGVGGLCAALKLANAGAEVTVLERAAAPGGKMRAVPSPAGPIDAGPTVFTLRHVFEGLFEEVGERLEDHLTLHAETVLARHWWPDGGKLDLYADPQASAQAVRAFAGKQGEQEFRRFCERARTLFEAFDEPVMQAGTPNLARLATVVMRDPMRLTKAMAPLSTLAQTLARDFSDPRLRQLFGRYATYVGGSPWRAPAILSLIWHAEAKGVWRIEGGMRALAQTLVRLAEARGAVFRYEAEATEIEVEAGAATAVRLADGERLEADQIVFNGDPAALRNGLLGEKPKRAVGGVGVAPRSLSAYVWTFAAKPVGADLVHHNVFFGRVQKSEFDDLHAGRMPTDPTLYICAQDRGDGVRGTDLERFEIIMNGPAVDPGKPPPPKEFQTCQTRTLETLSSMGLRFEPEPGLDALTTPHRFAELFPGSAGSLYGRSPHGMTATFARPTARSRIRGLYLAGGGVHPGAGVPMAAQSGRRAAEAILTDLASTSRSPRTATHGGMSTASPTTGRAPSPSSAS